MDDSRHDPEGTALDVNITIAQKKNAIKTVAKVMRGWKENPPAKKKDALSNALNALYPLIFKNDKTNDKQIEYVKMLARAACNQDPDLENPWKSKRKQTNPVNTPMEGVEDGAGRSAPNQGAGSSAQGTLDSIQAENLRLKAALQKVESDYNALEEAFIAKKKQVSQT